MAFNDINNFPLAGKPLGGVPAVATALKDTEHNADHQGLSDFPFGRYIRGANCANKNSVVGRCEIWLQASNALGATAGNREVADAGCPVYIYYSNTHIWRTTIQVVGADCFIAFTDAECEKPAAPVGIADYSAGAFINALHIKILTHPTGNAEVTSTQVLFSATAPGGVNGDNIPRGTTAPAGSMEEGLNDLETDVHTVINVGGGLAADVVTSNNLDIDATIEDAYENLVYGRMEEDDDNDGVVNNWLPYGAGAIYTLDNTHREVGTYAQRVQAPGPGLGIWCTPAWPVNDTDYPGHSVTVRVRVWTTHANSVHVELFDGVAMITAPATGNAGDWTDITIRQDRDAAAAGWVLRIYSAFATDFWVDRVQVSLGVTAKEHSHNPWGITYDITKTGDYRNWIINGEFKHWTNPAVAVGPPVVWYPDWWGPGANPPTLSNQDLVNYRFDTIGWELEMFAGESITAQFPIPHMIFGETGYLTGYIYGLGGANMPIQIDGGIFPWGSSASINFTPTIGVWRRFIIPIQANLGAGDLLEILIQMPAGNNNFVLDGLCFNRGMVPIAFKPSDQKIYTWDFNHAGVAPGFPTYLTRNGTLLNVLIDKNCWVHKITAYNAVAPGGAIVDTYEVFQNDAASGLITTITGADLTGGTQVGFTAGVPPIPFAQYDLLQVQLTDGGGFTANISCTVEAIGY